MMDWIIAIMSLTGVVLNIYKRKECFIIWGFTNFAWFLWDLYIESYAQSFLFFIYFILAIFGLYKWSKELK